MNLLYTIADRNYFFSFVSQVVLVIITYLSSTQHTNERLGVGFNDLIHKAGFRPNLAC